MSTERLIESRSLMEAVTMRLVGFFLLNFEIFTTIVRAVKCRTGYWSGVSGFVRLDYTVFGLEISQFFVTFVHSAVIAYGECIPRLIGYSYYEGSRRVGMHSSRF